MFGITLAGCKPDLVQQNKDLLTIIVGENEMSDDVVFIRWDWHFKRSQFRMEFAHGYRSDCRTVTNSVRIVMMTT